jgi:hypothetical protein
MPRRLIDEPSMGIRTVFLIVVLLMLVGVLTLWPNAGNRGHRWGGTVDVVLLVVIILSLMGRPRFPA